MLKFYKISKNSTIQFEIYHGWDKNIQKWFIELQLPNHKKCNIIEWFDTEDKFIETLEKIS